MSTISTQQLRFWNELTQLRGQIDYLCLYQLSCERVDRSLKMFLAVASSGSIAAWAVWRDFAMLWGGIIAASQLVSAIKSYLPFEKRLSASGELASKLEGLFVQWEGAWQQVADGGLSEREISDRITELKKVKVELENGCLKNNPLPDKPDLEKAAAKKAATYFKLVYQLGGTNEG
jgi:hypothetical protein